MQEVKFREKLIHLTLFLFALIPIITVVGIITILFTETYLFFQEISIVEFFTGTRWSPLLKPKSFGVLPLLAGTLLVTIGAMIFALPIGLGMAVYLGEYAPRRVRKVVKPLIEILAGIPTVVYGYLALLFITPIIRSILPQTNIFNALSASIAVAIMVLPMIASLSEDAISAVPRYLREGAYAMGANKYEATTRVVMPAAFSGIAASFVLALSRAIGETMIVTLAAGATPRLTLNPLESIQTITAYIVQVSLGETPRGTIEYKSIFAVGSVLFIITLLVNISAQRLIKRASKGAL